MDELFITSVHDGRNKYFLISKNFVRRIEEEYGEYLKVVMITSKENVYI